MDVHRATDMVVLARIYDMAVIVSGDQDYTPAVQRLKDYGKQVINVSFKARSGQLLPGGARRLNQVTDWALALTYEELKRHLGIGASVLPPATGR